MEEVVVDVLSVVFLKSFSYLFIIKYRTFAVTDKTFVHTRFQVFAIVNIGHFHHKQSSQATKIAKKSLFLGGTS